MRRRIKILLAMGILMLLSVLIWGLGQAETEEPTPTPTLTPTPMLTPTTTPTLTPTPTEKPTPTPTLEPTEEPTPTPTLEPTEEPTPTPEPTEEKILFSAEKISVSDTERMANGQEVILYTKVYNEETGQDELYVVDGQGNLIRAYDQGNRIMWGAEDIVPQSWMFFDYSEEDGSTTDAPMDYYDLRNSFSDQYIAPQISTGQVLSGYPIGINMDGRRSGKSSTTIKMWLDDVYVYSYLKADGGRIAACSEEEAMEFFFAVDSSLSDDELRGQCGDDVYWVFHTDAGVLTLFGQGEMWDYTNEDLADWYEASEMMMHVVIENGVTSIGNFAFAYLQFVTDIAIPDSVTRMGDYALESTGLTSLVIPDSVTSIGKCAFDGCQSLESVILSNNITEIPMSCFSVCRRLTGVVIPYGVTTIDFNAFGFCSELSSVTIPDSVTMIENSAFQGCSNLMGITIPESVKTIGAGAFSGCSSLIGITIPDTVTDIGESLFRDCISLSEFTIPQNMTSIGRETFYGCSSLSSIIIPDHVTSVGYLAFAGCSSLSSLILPGSVTSTDYRTFYRCTNLSSVSVPNNLTHIYEMAFLFCDSLNTIQIPGCTIEQDAFSPETVIIMTGIVPDFTLPEGLTTIDSEAFAGTSAHTIRIPAGVNLITLDAIPKTAMIITPKDAEIAQWFKEKGYTVVYEGD